MSIYKELFYDVITDGEIKDENIINFALYCAGRIPAYFWIISASSSGKYHPVTDLGMGGLVRHSLMVYRIAVDMLNATTNSRLLSIKDELLFACLFHDCCKNGIRNSGHTEHTHPLIAANFIEDCYKNFSNEDSEIKINIITEAIRSHMGKWTTSKYSNVELPTPLFEEEFFVHECDYIASRKYCLFNEEYFCQF